MEPFLNLRALMRTFPNDGTGSNPDTQIHQHELVTEPFTLGVRGWWTNPQGSTNSPERIWNLDSTCGPASRLTVDLLPNLLPKAVPNDTRSVK
jgi:hypothetical protein